MQTGNVLISPPMGLGPVLAARGGQCRTAAAASACPLRKGLDQGRPAPAPRSVHRPLAAYPEGRYENKIGSAAARTLPVSDGCRHEAVEPQIASVGPEGLHRQRFVVVVGVLELCTFAPTIDSEHRQIVKSVVAYLLDVDVCSGKGPQHEINQAARSQ
jgi:hypothetical protein